MSRSTAPAMHANRILTVFPSRFGPIRIVGPALTPDLTLRIADRVEFLGRLVDHTDPNSELSRLNRGADGWVSVSDNLAAVLDIVFGLYEDTSGRYDPTDRASGRPGGVPGLAGVDRRRHRIHLHGTRLDCGAIAAGLVVDAVVEHLIEAGVPEAVVSTAGVERSLDTGAMRGRPAVTLGDDVRIEAPTAAAALGLGTCPLPEDRLDRQTVLASCRATASIGCAD